MRKFSKLVRIYEIIYQFGRAFNTQSEYKIFNPIEIVIFEIFHSFVKIQIVNSYNFRKNINSISQPI